MITGVVRNKITTKLVRDYGFEPSIAESLTNDLMQLVKSNGGVHLERNMINYLIRYCGLPEGGSKSIANDVIKIINVHANR